MLGRSILFVCCLLALGSAAVAAPYAAPRTPEGQPSLQGEWTNLTWTPLQRPREFAGPVATKFEEIFWTAKIKAQIAGKPLAKPGAPPPEPNVGQSEWFDADVGLMRIGGQPRASIVTDPINGRLPYNILGRHVVAAAIHRDEEVIDGPEDRLSDERCLMGAGGPLAPPMMPPGYNAGYQIVQTPGFVVIEAEMIHDVRIIRLGGVHDRAAPQWQGDSIGHWEGETLVVETVNQHPLSAERFLAGDAVMLISPAARVVERFTRTAPGEIRYAFTVEDPAFYTRPWSGEEVFRTANQPLYEYACHEGNYALANILRGARHKEQEEAAAKAKQKRLDGKP